MNVSQSLRLATLAVVAACGGLPPDQVETDERREPVALTNTSDGSGAVNVQIERVRVHPTYRNQTAGQPGYDVALLDITTDTPSIPVQSAFRSAFEAPA